MIVEDNDDLAETMATFLSTLDLRCAVAGSVRAALDCAAEQTFDVAIVDIGLPDGDGTALVQTLRERSPFTEAILVTGRATVESAAAAVRAHAVDYVVKPVEAARLRECVEKALQRRNSASHQLQARLREERIAAVSTLASGLPHQLRNPLNAALLQLGLARRRMTQGNDDEHAGVLSCINAAEVELRRLTRLFDDFEASLEPSRPNLPSVPLVGLWQSIVHEAHQQAAPKSVSVRSELDERVSAFLLEGECFKTVLRQLIRNALEAMPQGGSLVLRARDGNGYLEIDVEDTGAGLDDERAIFDPFFTTKPVRTGLGLALVHRTLLDHGGDIRVSSRPGCTRFTVRLPQYTAYDQ